MEELPDIRRTMKLEKPVTADALANMLWNVARHFHDHGSAKRLVREIDDRRFYELRVTQLRAGCDVVVYESTDATRPELEWGRAYTSIVLGNADSLALSAIPSDAGEMRHSVLEVM